MGGDVFVTKAPQCCRQVWIKESQSCDRQQQTGRLLSWHAGMPLVAACLLCYFGRKRLNPDITKHEVPGTMYGLSNNEWMDRELFSDWFTHHFLTHAAPTWFQKLSIVIHSPPNATHLCQPLDKSGFGSNGRKLATWKGSHFLKSLARVNGNEDFNHWEVWSWLKALYFPLSLKQFL